MAVEHTCDKPCQVLSKLEKFCLQLQKIRLCLKSHVTVSRVVLLPNYLHLFKLTKHLIADTLVLNLLCHLQDPEYLPIVLLSGKCLWTQKPEHACNKAYCKYPCLLL